MPSQIKDIRYCPETARGGDFEIRASSVTVQETSRKKKEETDYVTLTVMHIVITSAPSHLFGMLFFEMKNQSDLLFV